MPRHPGYTPRGVIPAVLLPFFEDLSIDEASYRSHLRDVAAVAGISAITVNAHASEVASCTFEEQKRVLAITQDEIGERLPIVNGVYADGSLEAARIARMAHDGGASALAGFSVRNLHVRPAARDGGGAFPAHRRCNGSAADRLPVSARERARLSAGDTAEDHRGGAHGARDQGLVRESAAARAPDSRAAKLAACRSMCSLRTARGCSARWCSVATVCCPAADR